MNKIDRYMEEKLAGRLETGAYRELKTNAQLVDFCSNDYLGFARSHQFKNKLETELKNCADAAIGSTGSRLLAGNTAYAIELEQQLAIQFNSGAALLYNSGYDANLGLLSCLPQRGDTVLHDELIHASIIDGIRLSHANRHSFRHNDLQQLEDKLKRCANCCYVVVESVYSMDGDSAPLTDLAHLCKRYKAALIVDEAHATGLFGNGLVCLLNLEEEVFARVVTFGKALGCHGAVVLGSRLLTNYLINFSRSFIYTTAAPFHQLASIKIASQLLCEAEEARIALRNNIDFFKAQFKLSGHNSNLIDSASAIQSIILGSNEKAKQAALSLQQSGFDVRAILAPTVPAGTERLRICMHAYNTTQEISGLINILTQN